MVKRASWLSVTPEPERELPQAVATLAAGRRAPSQDVAREQARIERLVLRGSQRRWLQYLHDVVDLIDRRATLAESNRDVAQARTRALAVIANHHNLLLALPGRGAALTAGDRARLQEFDPGQDVNRNTHADNHERNPRGIA